MADAEESWAGMSNKGYQNYLGEKYRDHRTQRDREAMDEAVRFRPKKKRKRYGLRLTSRRPTVWWGKDGWTNWYSTEKARDNAIRYYEKNKWLAPDSKIDR